MNKVCTDKNQRVNLALLITIASLTTNVLAEHVHVRPDSHAPIGVMGDHVMAKDEIMFSYRYMDMKMKGNRDNTNRVSTPLPGYMVSPLKMKMRMHMLGGMYAPTDKLTLTLMVPFLDISMRHRVDTMMMSDVRFTTKSNGIGDVSVGGIYQLLKSADSNLLLNMALSVPTGSINEKDSTPASMGTNVHLPYPMQTSSGTYDITPGLTYTQTYDEWSWGVQGLYTHRLGDNKNNYTLGDKKNASLWAAKLLDHGFSVSARVNALDWNNIGGDDKKLSAMPTVPTKDTSLRGGTRVDTLLGVNYVASQLNHMRFAFEVGVPVYQHLNGPQLETDYVFTLGTQYTF